MHGSLLRQTGEYLQQKDIVKNSSTNWDVSLYTRTNSTALGCCQINFHIYLYWGFVTREEYKNTHRNLHRSYFLPSSAKFKRKNTLDFYLTLGSLVPRRFHTHPQIQKASVRPNINSSLTSHPGHSFCIQSYTICQLRSYQLSITWLGWEKHWY